MSSVSASGLSADWDQNILTANLGDPVYFDIYALSGGLSSGQFLSGFAIEFSWLGGAGGPGAQDYTILDPNNFSVLASGTTGACSSWRLGPCTDTYRFPRIIPGASTPSFPPTPLRLKAALQRT